MPIHAIAYTSYAVGHCDLRRVEELAKGAASFNRIAGVTGVLLFSGARFLQYVEGPEDGLAVVYGRILNATSHTELVELGQGWSGRRNFHSWSMKAIEVETPNFDFVLRQDWRSFELEPAGIGGAARHGVDALAMVVASPLSEYNLPLG